MQDGWIKIHRKLLEWEWYDDEKTFKVFIHCLLRANHDDKKWRGVLIKRGEFISSYGKLAQECNLSVQNIRTSLNKLKLTGELTSKSHSKYSLFKVNNYNEYQETNKQTNKQLTSNQQATNNKQELKELKELKEKEQVSKKSKDFLPFAERLAKIILENSPTDKQKYGSIDKMQKQINSWSDDFRKMKDIDKLTNKQIDFILQWLETGKSWWTQTNNIRSGLTLRKQTPKIIGEIKKQYISKEKKYVFKCD